MVIPSDGKVWLYGPQMAGVRSEEVGEDDAPRLEALRDYMCGVMMRANGIGLAAPQIGVFRRVVLLGQENGSILPMVNPDITRMWGREMPSTEACLSVPPRDNTCVVLRQEYVQVEFRDVDHFQVRSITLRGQEAFVAQHEIDHLDGVFFFDRTPHRIKVLEKYRKWKEEKHSYV